MSATMNVEDLRELQRLLASMVKECRVEIEECGWLIKCVDPAHVAALNIQVEASALGDYQAEPRMIQLDVERLGTMLKQAPRKGSVDIRLDDSHLTWEADNLTWRQRLIDCDTSDVRVPHMGNPATCNVDLAELVRSAKMAATVSEEIRLTLEGEALTLLSTDGSDDARMMLPTLKPSGRASVKLPLDYWQAAVKAIPQDTVTLELGDDRPVQFNLSAWDGGLSGRYLIAPRIDGEGVRA
jgi:hypothetical protein